MLDMYGTPYTRALHVLERYRLLDYEAAREELERDAKESLVIPSCVPFCGQARFLKVGTTSWRSRLHGRTFEASKIQVA
jgi:hypothetical protein